MMPSAGTLSRPGAVEACALARVAGRTVLDNSEQERVAVAIDPRVDHIRLVAARGSFYPHPTARPAPLRHAARLERLLERSLVHIRQHQDLEGIGILCDYRDKAVATVADDRQDFQDGIFGQGSFHGGRGACKQSVGRSVALDKMYPAAVLRFLYELPRKILILLVRGYQLMISPHIGGACRYQPTCTAYSIEAFKKYGAMRGLVLTVYRIGRDRKSTRLNSSHVA